MPPLSFLPTLIRLTPEGAANNSDSVGGSRPSTPLATRAGKQARPSILARLRTALSFSHQDRDDVVEKRLRAGRVRDRDDVVEELLRVRPDSGGSLTAKGGGETLKFPLSPPAPTLQSSPDAGGGDDDVGERGLRRRRRHM